MSQRDRLRSLLQERSLRFGDFTLVSGRKSSYYFDSKQTTLHPEGAYLTAWCILDLVRREGIDAAAIGGMTLGADPMVCAVAPLSFLEEGPELPAFIVRKETKDHGTTRQIEGDRVVLHITFSRLAMRTVENYDHLDEAWLEGKPHELSIMLGREDFLGTSTIERGFADFTKIPTTFGWAKT